MASFARIILCVLLAFLLSGCAHGGSTLVVLSPGPDGKTGAITVSNPAGSVDISSPYQATTIGDRAEAPSPPSAMGRESANALFADALSAQPKSPVHFILYFEKDILLTPESTLLLPKIVTAIQERNSIDISVVGHTDSVGSKEYNMTLSRNRANSVKDQLIRMGIDDTYIRTTSHGKENPLIKTGDNVAEPRNRRVEVIVR